MAITFTKVNGNRRSNKSIKHAGSRAIVAGFETTATFMEAGLEAGMYIKGTLAEANLERKLDEVDNMVAQYGLPEKEANIRKQAVLEAYWA